MRHQPNGKEENIKRYKHMVFRKKSRKMSIRLIYKYAFALADMSDETHCLIQSLNTQTVHYNIHDQNHHLIQWTVK